MHHVGIALAGVVALATSAVPTGRAGANPVDEAIGVSKEVVRIRTETGDQRLEGNVVVEAVDGGLLLELADQRLEIVSPEAILAREPIAGSGEPPTARELGRRILAELPDGFDQLSTKHYLICFDTSRAYAQWCGGLFERLHEAFANFWRQAGFEVHEAGRPLVVVIFADRQRYEAFAAEDLGAAADRVVGYYNLLSNRVTTFDLTGSDAITRRPGRSAGRAGLEILARPEAAGLVATLVHEATHQTAFNCGLHRRLAPVPLWVSEGIATYFETPDLASDRGWRGIGGINRPRLDRFLAAQRPGAIPAIVLEDEPFRRADEALDNYARAWALTYFLVQTRREAFVSYLRTLAEKPPFAADSPEIRRREFLDAFGSTPEELEEPLLKFIARLR
jgi:hypothetical protein